MAYYNHFEGAQKKRNKENYSALKEFITSKDEKGIISEWFPAYNHIVELEDKIEKMEKEIKAYKDFFKTMDSLLPRRSSTTDIIG